jgi:hypothetical protein
MNRYEVIPSRRWQSAAGRTASIYGAVPYRSDAEKARDGWQVVTVGWTIRDNDRGTVGIGRAPFATRADADAWAAARAGA